MLKPGAQLGPYEIIAALGKGGMGEVYRARDPRLGREVAIKVLPMAFSSDADRLRRFEQEARSASALNHPNIVTIFDIGREGSTPYIAMELVEGKSLREILAAGPLPTKKILQVAAQVADGLAKAHAAGIVHRDLKPENLMMTSDGLVKILDFGLAKLTHAEVRGDSGSQAMTLSQASQAGAIVGTAGYMSPEQASAVPIDFRSDQFSLGVILYEMITGKRAFQRATAVETLSAIIRDEPEPVLSLNPKIPAPIRWVTERCLAKNAEDRYASTRDLARELQNLREHLLEAGGTESGILARVSPSPEKKSFLRSKAIGLGAALVAALAIFLLVMWGRASRQSAPTFRQLTFRLGNTTGAAFAPDGHTIVYSASWDGNPLETFTTSTEGPESRSLGLPRGTSIQAVSSTGELAITLGCVMGWGGCVGTLAQVPLAGGAPREVLENVSAVDWFPDGKSLAVVHITKGKYRLECPIGKVLYEAPGSIPVLRVSPRGDLIAFFETPALGAGNGGSVMVADLTGKIKTLAAGWESLGGIAWSASGDEVWISGGRTERNRALWAVTLSGKERLVLRLPGDAVLSDISREGRVLLDKGELRSRMACLPPGAAKERDLYWYDRSTAADLSPDGRTLLFYEWGVGEGGKMAVYLRKTDGSDAVRLGEGRPLALSPDGKWALTLQQSLPPQLVLLPTGPGQQKTLPRGGLNEYFTAGWFPDGQRIVFAGSEAGLPPRTYVQDIDGGSPRPVTPKGMAGALLSPDGKLVAAVDRYGEFYLCPLNGGEPRPLEGTVEGDTLLQWSSDGKSLFVRGAQEDAVTISRLDLSTGRRQLWKKLRPPDPVGMIGFGYDPGQIRLTPDGKSYVYTYYTLLDELYVVDGLK